MHQRILPVVLLVLLVTACGSSSSDPVAPRGAEKPSEPTQPLWIATAGAADQITWVKDVRSLSGGDAVACGAFTSTTTFGLGETNETTLTGTGGLDGWVARFDEDDGSLVWARVLQVTDYCDVHEVAPLDDDGCVVGGYFFGEITLGSGETNETTLTSAGSEDGFVARYDEDGLLEWAVQIGDTGLDQVLGIDVLPDGTTVVGGPFLSDSLSFDGGPTFDRGDGTIDGFVAWLDSDDGSIEDAMHVESLSEGGLVTVWSVAAMQDESVAVVGDFIGTFTIRGNNAESYDSFNESYDSWSARLKNREDVDFAAVVNGALDNRVFGVYAAEEADHIRVAGDFEGETTFVDPGDPDKSVTLDGFGQDDGYALAHEGDGTIDFAVAIGDVRADSMYDPWVDKDGRTIVIGFVRGEGGVSQGTLVGIDSEGGIDWEQDTVGAGAAYGLALDALPDGGDLYVGGSFQGTATFKNADAPPDAVGLQDAIIARLERSSDT